MITSVERNPNFPDVPTVVELGLPAAAAGRAYFFGFPLGTDEAILQKMSDAMGAIAEKPEYGQRIREAFGLEPFFMARPYVQEFIDEIWEDMAGYRDYLLITN